MGGWVSAVSAVGAVSAVDAVGAVGAVAAVGAVGAVGAASVVVLGGALREMWARVLGARWAGRMTRLWGRPPVTTERGDSDSIRTRTGIWAASALPAESMPAGLPPPTWAAMQSRAAPAVS